MTISSIITEHITECTVSVLLQNVLYELPGRSDVFQILNDHKHSKDTKQMNLEDTKQMISQTNACRIH